MLHSRPLAVHSRRFFVAASPAACRHPVVNGWPSFPLPTDLAANVALTDDIDSLQGGYSINPLQLYLGPRVGVNLGRQTVLDLGPAIAATGNNLSGYGDASGVHLSTQELVDGLHINSYAIGVILGSDFSDNIYGQSYGIASGAIENYGVILLAGGSDCINENATTLAFGGYGLTNWGLIDTGGENRKDANDSISGIGNTVGIQNATLTVDAASLPKISMGAGADIITGQAEEDNFGILNDGLIDMGTGNDRDQSLVNDRRESWADHQRFLDYRWRCNHVCVQFRDVRHQCRQSGDPAGRRLRLHGGSGRLRSASVCVCLTQPAAAVFHAAG